MLKYFFMPRVLKFIGEGTLFSRIFASALRVFAVLLSIGALVGWIQLWKLVFVDSWLFIGSWSMSIRENIELWMFAFDRRGAAILGGVLFQAFFLVGLYMVVHTLWIRAADIQAIGKSEFTIIPIVSIFLRMLGEIYACISVAVGIGGGVLQLFAGDSGLASRATSSIPGLGWQQSLLSGLGWQQSLLSGLFGGYTTSSFISALLLMVGGAIGALFWLVWLYLASEFIVVLVDIARNTRALRETVERHAQSGQNP